MDYSYYSAPPPQQYYIPYDLGANKLNPQDHLDPSFLPYDAFSFPSLPDGSPTAPAGPPSLQAVGSVDSGINLDLDNQPSHAHPAHPQGAASLHQPAGAVSSSSALAESPHSPTRTRSSSEEKETQQLTPAQSRRKAQNRAAQRAFRERKERHVRELEAKLSALESSAHSLQSDNEKLKLLLQRAKTENDILRSSGRSGSLSPPSPSVAADDGLDLLDRDPYTAGRGSSSRPGSLSASSAPFGSWGGRTQLSANAAWDLIQSHRLVKAGVVDVADVSERLRGAARCDGSGPVFEEAAVYKVIEESRRGGGDELI